MGGHNDYEAGYTSTHRLELEMQFFLSNHYVACESKRRFYIINYWHALTDRNSKICAPALVKENRFSIA